MMMKTYQSRIITYAYGSRHYMLESSNSASLAADVLIPDTTGWRFGLVVTRWPRST